MTAAADFAWLEVGGSVAFYPTSEIESPSNGGIHQESKIQETIPSAMRTIRSECCDLTGSWRV